MNDADRKAFKEWYKKQIWGNASWEEGVFEGFEFGLEWRDSQVGEPVASRFRYLNRDGLPITAWSASCDHPMYQHPALEIQPLYTAPPAAQINQQLVEALAFYADPLRYQGPNQKVDEGDKYTPDGFPYRMDVTRDGGEIARAALAATQMRGDA